MTRTCGECAKRMTKECPKYEYKGPGSYELNQAACMKSDKACNDFSKRRGAITSDDKQESQADRLVKLCLQQPDLELFHDQTKSSYMRVRNGPALVTMPIKSRTFREWISNLMWINEEKVPGTEGVMGASRVLKGMARFQGDEHRLYNRVAPAPDGVWLDMCDPDWRAIHVTADGWRIVDEPPILFKRYSHQKPLPEPKTPGDPFLFLEFVNIPIEDETTRLVVLVAAISYLIPDIPHIILVLYGIQGSGKTLLFKLLRDLIDPSAIGVLTVPRDERERVQQLAHHWCAFYDNINRFPDWISDTMCRAATGGGFSKRELYTDDDDIIYNFRRCVGLNGINIAAQRGDLLDRSLLVGLKNIPEEKRETEEDLLARFQDARPYILGGFLDALVKAIQVYPSVNSQRLFRMADFTRWGCAIAMALKYTESEFLEAYGQKVRDQIKEAAHASAVATVLLDYMEGLPKWKGTPSALYGFLNAHAKTMGVSTRQKEWPKAPHSLSRKLNELAPSLKALGWEVTRLREGEEGTRIILINSVNSVSSVSKPPKTDASDGSDTISTSSSRAIKPTTCPYCKGLLPEDLKNTTIVEGKTWHIECAKKYREGRKRGG